MQYYVNGKFQSNVDASIPLNDAGFLYGDGLFETMRFENKKIFAYDKHLDRLYKGLSVIGLKIEQDKSSFVMGQISKLNDNFEELF